MSFICVDCVVDGCDGFEETVAIYCGETLCRAHLLDRLSNEDENFQQREAPLVDTSLGAASRLHLVGSTRAGASHART